MPQIRASKVWQNTLTHERLLLNQEAYYNFLSTFRGISTEDIANLEIVAGTDEAPFLWQRWQDVCFVSRNNNDSSSKHKILLNAKSLQKGLAYQDDMLRYGSGLFEYHVKHRKYKETRFLGLGLTTTVAAIGALVATETIMSHQMEQYGMMQHLNADAFGLFIGAAAGGAAALAYQMLFDRPKLLAEQLRDGQESIGYLPDGTIFVDFRGL